MSQEVKKNDLDKDFSVLLKERERQGDIGESLKEIYQEEGDALIPASKNNDGNYLKENSMATISRRDVNPWRKITWTFLLLLLVLAGISWTSFLIFNEGNRLNTKDIEFNISGPETATVGQELVYDVQYKNLSPFNLKDVEIYVNYPSSFVFVDAVPAPIAGNHIWKLEQIDTKRSGRIEFKGRLLAAADTQAIFPAAITYRPENFSSTFGADSGLTTTVNSVGLNINIEAPSFFNVKEEAAITVKYAKLKESYLNNFKVIFNAGDDFSLSGSDKSGVWTIANLPDTQQQLSIKGQYAAKPAAGEKLKLSLAAPQEIKVINEAGEVTAQTKDYVFYEYEWSPIVAAGALNLSLTVNGATADKPVNFNDTLNYVVHYKNTSEATLKNIIIMATIDSSLVDWQTLQDEQKGEVKEGAIIWTKEQIRNLAAVKPNEEDSFGFAVKIKGREQIKDLPSADVKIRTALDYSIDSALNKADNPSAQIVNAVNSDLQFNNEVRYFDRQNIAVGEGPLPPKVGQKTSWHVYWTLTNSLHDLENITVSAALADGVRWENNAVNAIGAVNYLSDRRVVNWTISSLDAVAQPALLDFVVSLTPPASAKNKVLPLLNQARVEAKDKQTGGVIVFTAKAKTTNLEDDELGKGQGKVE